MTFVKRIIILVCVRRIRQKYGDVLGAVYNIPHTISMIILS